MLCERCGKREANVHITRNINGRVTKENVCSECADMAGEMNFGSVMRDFFSSVMPARARRFDYRGHEAISEYAGCEDCLEESYPEFKQKETNEDKITELTLRLKQAVNEERYEDAARLRDEIKSLKES